MDGVSGIALCSSFSLVLCLLAGVRKFASLDNILGPALLKTVVKLKLITCWLYGGHYTLFRVITGW